MERNEAGNVHVSGPSEAYDQERETELIRKVAKYHREVLVPYYRETGGRCPPAPGIESSL